MVQSVQDMLPQPDQRPAAELAVDRRPLVKLFRKVTPRRSRPRYPDNTIQKKTMIGWLAPIRLLSRLADFLPWAALVAPGAVLNKEITSRGWEKNLASGWVTGHWEQLVGEKIAQHTKVA